MLTISQIYKIIKDNHRERIPFIYNWRKNPYTFLKMQIYQTVSAVLVYWWLKTKIKPNTITVIYALAGLLGGILLAIPTRTTVILAAVIFFSKGILDAADGQYARLSGQTSYTGDILDYYGAHLGALGLQVGLGFFVAHKSGMVIFYYLIPVIPLCYAADLIQYIKRSFLDPGAIAQSLEVTPVVREQKTQQKEKSFVKRPVIDNLARGLLKPLFLAVRTLLDNRSRSVDLICLLAIIEMYSSLFITWVIFLLFVAKQVLIFISTFYQAVGYGWAEDCQVRIADEIRAFYDNLHKKPKAEA